jgi:hypothetical protein
MGESTLVTVTFFFPPTQVFFTFPYAAKAFQSLEGDLLHSPIPEIYNGKGWSLERGWVSLQGPENFSSVEECKRSPSRDQTAFPAWTREEKATARTCCNIMIQGHQQQQYSTNNTAT